ncbi:hypothetical protein BDV93DRAFT_457550, partial [Ceratobasidium sp. AG-I]
VAGLASRAKRSAVVQHKFEEFVASVPGLSRSAHPALACRVKTRWNTEHLCLQSHVHMRPAVTQLTSDQDLSLKRYQLTREQWELANRLASELKACGITSLNFNTRLTLLFSKTEVPLIHQVIPALLKLRDQLQATMKNPAPGLHPLLRVAACASLEVFNKYMGLFQQSAIYWVAIVMCPHYKLEWFKRRYSEPELKQIKVLVQAAFDYVANT